MKYLTTLYKTSPSYEDVIQFAKREHESRGGVLYQQEEVDGNKINLLVEDHWYDSYTIPLLEKILSFEEAWEKGYRRGINENKS